MGDVRGKTVLRVAKKLGYEERVPKGKKHYVIVDGSSIVAVIPRGRIKRGTLRKIVKALGLTWAEFNALI